MNNKELINAGHALAKAISNDTPLIEIAKMVSNLATQLDVQLARSNALAAENTGLKSVVSEINNELYGHGFQVSGWHLNGAIEPLDSWFEENNWNPETPATDAFLAEVLAQGVEMFANAQEKIADDELIGGNFDLSLRFRGMSKAANEFAAQLRKGVQS